ncbi:LuxR family transcriptional regulator [Pseudonocardia adelaidensis]|uniref:LuxR family transcriptional regulator n=2 Tax=Pseudonocardia adelaidensis TaxID=648754 RepID=A0ABP9NUM6_9PSEU
MIQELLDAAREGVSGALIVRGEPGIGKTSLLDHAAERADGMRVMRGAGIESETELPFAGLHLLFRTELHRLDALPGPQRRALAGAFGLGAGSGDRFMIGAAVLSLLAEAAEHAPVLCLVDDAHWLDRPSADALLFAARRLDREGVVILFAARDYTGMFTSAGIAEVHLTGLDTDSASALLDDGGVALPPALRDQLIADTRGNPLALRELPAVVAAEGHQLGPLPLTSSVHDAFHHQVRALPTPSQTLLLLAAADDTGELPLLLKAAGEMGVGVAHLAPAETSALVTVTGGALTFRHPLIRAAVYHGAAVGQRIATHAALAAACTGRLDADRRSWHLALAATGPDEDVASELEMTAVRAAGRNGYATAASAYERAAQLSPDPVAAVRRLTLACEAGVESGQLEWAKTRAQRVLPETTDPAVRARLTDVVARAEFVGGTLHDAHDLLIAGAELIARDDPERAFWMLVDALHTAWAAPTDQRLIAEPVDRLETLGIGPAEPLMSVAWLARWATAASLDRDTSTFPPLDEVVLDARAAGAQAGPRGMAEVTIFAFLAARDHVSAEVAAALVADARAHGTIFALPTGLAHLALTQTLLGNHREALVSGTEALRIARETGQPLWERYACGALAYLAAVAGDEKRCREHAEGADLAPGSPLGSSAGNTWAQTALALLDLGCGRVHDAFDRLHAALHGPTRHQSSVVRSIPDLVEAAVRLGRPEDAADPIARYTRWADSMNQSWIDALLARCRAMISTGPEAERQYLRALTLHESRSRPFERARTELRYGEWLRRSRRTMDARAHLTAALHVFEDLGSAPWAARARAELGATGAATPRPAASDVFTDLTPQELQIIQLAAQGLSNRDIAAQLFLSPRTVAYHLYKAYPKLGINSRADLAGLTQP